MRQTRAIKVKHVQIGSGAPIAVQSMTKTDTTDVGATVAQIEEMMRAGCEIVRVAVPDKEAASALKEIRNACLTCRSSQTYTFITGSP